MAYKNKISEFVYKLPNGDIEYKIKFNWKERDCSSFTNAQFQKVKEIFNEIKDDDIKYIFDIGANIGMYSLFFNYFYPNAKTYSFEPIFDSYSVMQDNVKDIKNIETFNFGLWNSNGNIILGLPKNIEIQSPNYGFYWNKEKKYNETIKTKTLNSVCNELKVTPDLIKIDVEGAEFEVLYGGLEVLRNIKYIVVEYRRKLELPSFNIVEELLIDNGFNLVKTFDKFDKLYINK